MTGTNCRPLILTIPPTPLIQSTSLLLYSVYISYLVCISRQKRPHVEVMVKWNLLIPKKGICISIKNFMQRSVCLFVIVIVPQGGKVSLAKSFPLQIFLCLLPFGHESLFRKVFWVFRSTFFTMQMGQRIFYSWKCRERDSSPALLFSFPFCSFFNQNKMFRLQVCLFRYSSSRQWRMFWTTSEMSTFVDG